MPSRSVRWLVVLCAALWPLAAGAQRASFEHTTDRLIVKWKAQSAAQAQIRTAPDRRVPAQVLGQFATRAGVGLSPHRAMSGGAQVLKLPARKSLAEARAIAARLAADPEIEFAVPDQRRFPSAAPNDAYYVGKLQPNLGYINVPAAWDVTTGSASLVVAVIDTGALAHPDLAGRLLPGYDFVTEAYGANDGGGRDATAADPGDWVSPEDVADMNSPFDAACLYGGIYETPSSWHGTHIAGIIAANGNNQAGIAGINWGSKILPVRVLGKCGGFDSDIIDGMRWAAGLAVPNAPANANPARVLNMSLGGPGACNAAYQSAIDEISALGKVIVAAAGNELVDFKTVTPASCQGLLATAAFQLNAAGTIAENFGQAFYSNYGTAADTNLFALPGNAIWSSSDSGERAPANSGSYFYEYGTSSAAAHLSGLVSLMLSANPSLTPAEIKQQLRLASTSLGDWSGSGKPDALRAIGNALAYRGPTVTPVSLAVSGPATFFEERSASYAATVTWSDASTSTAYPVWSMDAGAAGVASINSTGVLSGGGISADRAMTVQASFAMNGITVNGTLPVTMLDNRVVQLAVTGPDTVNLSSPTPAKYSLVVSWADGSVYAGDVTTTQGVWSADVGAISAAGYYVPAQLGPATISVSDSGLTATKDITVVAGTPSSPSLTLDCASESTVGLTLGQVNFLDVGSSANVVPLCNGVALVADNVAHRIDAVDVRAGTVAKSWSFGADRPYRMVLASGTSFLFVTFLNSAKVARVDLAADAVLYLANVPSGNAAYLDAGDDGQVWVLHAIAAQFPASLTRYEISTGSALGTHDLGKAALYFKYSKQRQVLVTTDFSQRTSFNYRPAETPVFPQRESLFDAGGLLTAMSPDGARVLLGGKDLDVQTLTSSAGSYGVGAAGYRPDGRRLAGNLQNLNNDLAVYSTDRHERVQTYAKPANCPYWSYQYTGFSPAGAFLYGYEQCGSSGEFGRLFWIPVMAEPVPDAIAFDSAVGATPGGPAVSNSVTLTGFAGTASVSVTGGEYSLNGQAFTAAPGTATAGQTVAVRATASGDAYATVKAVLAVGGASAEFLVTTGPALAAQWWNPSCASEADLGAMALRFVDIDPSWDLIVLCDGRLLVGNRSRGRVELYDLRAGAAVRAWSLKAMPQMLRRVPGTSFLLVVTDASSLARVDLATGQVGEIFVGGRPFAVTPGEPGEIIVASQAVPTANTLEGDTLSRHNPASGAELARSFLGASLRATLLRYDPARHLLYAGDGTHSPARLTRLDASFNALEYSLDAGDYAHDIALSPDGTRLAYPVEGGVPDLRELDPLQLGAPKGKYYSGPWPRAAEFSADGAKLLVGSEKDPRFVNGVAMFDVATRALERYWLLPHCDLQQGRMRSVRFSPSGGYALALETCGSTDGDNARLYWVRTDAAGTMPQPDSASFVSRAGVPVSAVIESNGIVISGIGGAQLPISVDNGTYFISPAGSYAGSTTANGSVRDGDRVWVYNNSWFASGVKTTTTLNVGGRLFAFDVTTGSGADSAPDPFQLITLKQQAPNSTITSNTIVVSGITAAAPISVTGGSYSIDGGAFTSAAGTVTNGQTVTVQVTSPAALNSASMAILTIGNASSAFTVTTGAFDNTPDALAFGTRKQPARNAWVESPPLSITGLGGPALVSVAGGEYRVGAGAFTSVPGTVSAGQSVTLRAMSGASFGAVSTATATIGTATGSFSTAVGMPLADHDGNGKSDVFWMHVPTGQTYVWQMNGTAISAAGSPASTGDANWKVAGLGDFDGDGKSDVLFRHAVSGATFVWLMNGTAITGSGSPGTIADLGWKVKGTGDFDGDGKTDVLWTHTDGRVQIWLMNGTAMASSGQPADLGPSSGWAVQGVGDFDGNGKADILWKHSSGTVVMWLMNGATIASSGAVANVGPDTATGWRVQGVGDFNGDGKADVLWRNDDIGGVIYVWLMNGTTITSATNVTGVGTEAGAGWIVKAIGDYDGDGKADVFWKNDLTLGGITYVWLMNGTSISSATSVTGVPGTDWQVQSPNESGHLSP